SNPTLSATILYRSYRPYRTYSGEVQEWLNWQHWKCCERETVPWVRIPPSPPELQRRVKSEKLEEQLGRLYSSLFTFDSLIRWAATMPNFGFRKLLFPILLIALIGSCA